MRSYDLKKLKQGAESLGVLVQDYQCMGMTRRADACQEAADFLDEQIKRMEHAMKGVLS